MTDRNRRRRRIYLWLGYWAVLFTLTHIPVSGLGAPAIRHADKVVHAVLYFLLTLLGGRAVLNRDSSGLRIVFWAAVYAGFAAFDEWSQQFVGRTPSVADWFADLVGIVLASAGLYVRRHREAST